MNKPTKTISKMDTIESAESQELIRQFVVQVSKPIDASVRLELIQQVVQNLKPHYSQLSRKQYFYLWKGFFYAIWYTEMERGARQSMEWIAQNCSVQTLFIGIEVLNQEWFTIDYIRVDKFMSFARLLLAKLLRVQFKACVLAEKEGKDNQTQLPSKIKSKLSLYRKLLKQLSTVGLLEHILDISLEETFKVLGKYLRRPSLSLRFIKSVVGPLVHRLSSDTDPRVLEQLQKEIENIFEYLKRYHTVLTGVCEYTIQQVERLAETASMKNRKALNRLKNELQSRRKLLAQRPVADKQRYTYNRRKALKKKQQKLKGKRLEQLAKRRSAQHERYAEKRFEGDTLEELLQSL